jgi:hypothetical protein
VSGPPPVLVIVTGRAAEVVFFNCPPKASVTGAIENTAGTATCCTIVDEVTAWSSLSPE